MEMSVILFLKDQYLQLCRDKIYHSGKSTDYRIFKEIINLEAYLLLLNKNHRSIFTHYHTANHRLPIEVSRWENIPRSEQTCYLCEDDVIGDEYHFLFECYFFRNKRCQYLPKYYYIRPNAIKYHDLFCSTNITLLNNNFMITFVTPH